MIFLSWLCQLWFACRRAGPTPQQHGCGGVGSRDSCPLTGLRAGELASPSAAATQLSTADGFWWGYRCRKSHLSLRGSPPHVFFFHFFGGKVIGAEEVTGGGQEVIGEGEEVVGEREVIDEGEVIGEGDELRYM